MIAKRELRRTMALFSNSHALVLSRQRASTDAAEITAALHYEGEKIDKELAAVRACDAAALASLERMGGIDRRVRKAAQNAAIALDDAKLKRDACARERALVISQLAIVHAATDVRVRAIMRSNRNAYAAAMLSRAKEIALVDVGRRADDAAAKLADVLTAYDVVKV